MGTTVDSAIVSIGAVIFDPRLNKSGDKFYAELDWENQSRNYDEDTLAWWGKQSEKARRALNGLDDLEESLIKLAAFLPGDAKVWGNGPCFDISILEHAYLQLGLDIPWKFWNVRDCRTVLDMYEFARGGLSKSMVKSLEHNALSDAIAQAKQLCKMWRILCTK
jgi:hypothetical protein